VLWNTKPRIRCINFYCTILYLELRAIIKCRWSLNSQCFDLMIIFTSIRLIDAWWALELHIVLQFYWHFNLLFRLLASWYNLNNSPCSSTFAIKIKPFITITTSSCDEPSAQQNDRSKQMNLCLCLFCYCPLLVRHLYTLDIGTNLTHTIN